LITNPKFESAKKAILAESPISAIPPVESMKTRKLRLFGVLGLLSLVLPWDFILFCADVFGYGGSSIEWHLFHLLWIDIDYARFVYVIAIGGNATSLLYDFLSVLGFFLVLAGSILLLRRKRFGGILMLVSWALWVISCAINLNNLPYNNYPIGAVLCGIVGAVSLIYRE
jgi:hypothetical protein